MTEIWKPVEGYEGFYEVSNTGKVRSLPREIYLKGSRAGEKRTYKGKELQPLRSKDSVHINLQRCGERKNISLGLLVAYHFLEGFKESGKTRVKYIDGDIGNCSVENLTFAMDE